MKKFIILFLLISSVSAFNVDFGVYDINTNIPIEGANVTIYNQSLNFLEVSGLTNADGLVSLAVTTQSTDYYIYFSKIGYEDYFNFNYNISNETQDNIYLRPFSTSGIIRITVTDLTFTNHQYCIYFKDNNRLYDCFHTNETLVLHNNYEYIMRIRLGKADIYSSPELNKKSLNRLIYPFFMICIAIALLGGLHGLWKKNTRS